MQIAEAFACPVICSTLDKVFQTPFIFFYFLNKIGLLHIRDRKTSQSITLVHVAQEVILGTMSGKLVELFPQLLQHLLNTEVAVVTTTGIHCQYLAISRRVKNWHLFIKAHHQKSKSRM